MAMSVCRGGGMGHFRFLFEAVPDLLPYKYFTNIEAELWAMFLDDQEKQRGGRS